VAGLTWLFLRQPARPTPPTFIQLTDQPGAELYPSVSPDGRSFVYQGKSADKWDIYFQRVGGKNPVNLTRGSNVDNTQPAFSPDGQRIAFRSEREGGGIFLMGATGEDVKRLTDFGYNPAWSPDGKELVCTTAWFLYADSRLDSTQSQIFRINVSTGEKQLVRHNRSDAVQAHWSPHGQRLAFWGVRDGYRDIWTVPASGGQAVPVTHDAAIDWNPVWSPDGKYLYFSSDRAGTMNLWRVPINESSGKLLGPLEPVTTPSLDSGFMSFSPDGKRLLYVQQTMTSNLFKVAFDPFREATIGQPLPIQQGAVRFDLSPDGRWLVFQWLHGKQEDLFVIGSDGKGLRQLTDDIYKDRHPRWSPDGKTIAFFSNRSGNWQTWTIHPDGSGLTQLTHEARANVNNPVWSPDGSQLAYVIKDVNSFIIDVRKPWSAQSPVPLPRPSSLDAYLQVNSWSPDGRQLAGDVQFLSGAAGIGVYSLESHEFKRLTQMGRSPRYLSDSRRLLFVHSDKLYLVDSQSNRVHEVLSMAPQEAVWALPSRDDRSIYLARRAREADVWQMSLGDTSH
jgi:tricorn protease